MLIKQRLFLFQRTHRHTNLQDLLYITMLHDHANFHSLRGTHVHQSINIQTPINTDIDKYYLDTYMYVPTCGEHDIIDASYGTIWLVWILPPQISTCTSTIIPDVHCTLCMNVRTFFSALWMEVTHFCILLLLTDPTNSSNLFNSLGSLSKS